MIYVSNLYQKSDFLLFNLDYSIKLINILQLCHGLFE